MRVNELKLVRKFNLGNYEHKEISISCAVGETENPHSVFNEMEAFVKSRLNASEVLDTTIEETKVEETKVEETKVGETKVEETKVEETKVEETKVEGVEKKSPKKAAKRATVSKNTPYNRELDDHKKLFGSILDAALPGWRVKDSAEKTKAVSASLTLNGQDFLDSEGEILETFIAKVSEQVK